MALSKMDVSEAIYILHCHAGNLEDDANWERFDSGFLGMLRPYRGLCETNFHEIMVALFKVAPTFQETGHIDNKLAHSIWTICSTAHGTGVREGSMLRRNCMISDEDLNLLSDWVRVFERACQSLIMGIDTHISIEGYAEYLTRYPKLYTEPEFILKLIERNLKEVDGSIDPTVCIEAVGVFGILAHDLEPLIIELDSLNYTYCEPYELANREVSEAVANCLSRLKKSN